MSTTTPSPPFHNSDCGIPTWTCCIANSVDFASFFALTTLTFEVVLAFLLTLTRTTKCPGKGVFTQELETPAIVKAEVVRYVRYARYVSPIVFASFQLLIFFRVFTLDIIESRRFTAFSKLSLEDPPIYQVANVILYILFRLVCAGPLSLETLKRALARPYSPPLDVRSHVS